jgi:hypothetical protein
MLLPPLNQLILSHVANHLKCLHLAKLPDQAQDQLLAIDNIDSSNSDNYELEFLAQFNSIVSVLDSFNFAGGVQYDSLPVDAFGLYPFDDFEQDDAVLKVLEETVDEDPFDTQRVNPGDEDTNLTSCVWVVFFNVNFLLLGFLKNKTVFSVKHHGQLNDIETHRALSHFFWSDKRLNV